MDAATPMPTDPRELPEKKIMDARKHVDKIRRRILSIGRVRSPWSEFLWNVTSLSVELLKMSEDREYPEGVDPSLGIVITTKDIAGTGAPATLLAFINDKGFAKEDIELLTKKGTGLMKSLFLVTDQPYIFSNGYQIRFTQCSAYNVPEWVEMDPILPPIASVYGSATALPTTILVLPLKPDKVKPVKDLLFRIHPEVLLFLPKLRRLSVREDNEDPKLKIKTLSYSRDKSKPTSDNKREYSYTIYLTGGDGECSYYVWEQRFPVKPENKVRPRKEVDELVIALAFPFEEVSERGSSLPGIYSFLPTETVTNFPFIIQADFLLASSRRNIRWDNRWNQGILDCVPDAFVNAFTALVTSIKGAPLPTLLNMFRFLPVNESSHPELNHVRDAIKAKVLNKPIFPLELPTERKFCKPIEVGWVKPAFGSILDEARVQGLIVSDFLSHRANILDPASFDTDEYNDFLHFLEIAVDYSKCISSSNLVMSVSEDVYVQLLLFIAQGWKSWFNKKSIKNTPLIKYVRPDGKVGLLTLVSCTDKLLAADLDSKPNCISWMIKWNREFQSPNGYGNREYLCSKGPVFLPKVTQEAIKLYLQKLDPEASKSGVLKTWLMEAVGIEFVNVEEYAKVLRRSVKYDHKQAVTYAGFLYASSNKAYLKEEQVKNLCSKMPIVDESGKLNVRTWGALVPTDGRSTKSSSCSEQSDTDKRRAPSSVRSLTLSRKVIPRGKILVPAKGSKWVELLGRAPWRHENYVELGRAYTHGVKYFGGVISGEDLVSFLGTNAEVSDVPYLSPPNTAIPTLFEPLTKKNAYLLLDWIHELSNTSSSSAIIPGRFLLPIKYNDWLKVSFRGPYRPPTKSFMLELDSPIGNFLRDGLMLPFSVPLVDEQFYGPKIRGYKKELLTIGVRMQDSEACKYIAKLATHLAASSELTKDHLLAILKFIECLGNNHIPSQYFIKRISGEKWIRTSHGNMSRPSGSVLFSKEWKPASQISNLPTMDEDYYRKEVLSFKKQLRLLGVAVSVDKSYQLVLDNLKTSSSLTSLSSEAMLLLLRCIKSLESSDERVKAIKYTECLMTNLDYRCPSECFLLNPDQSQWGCILQVFGSFPVIDEQFYGSSIYSMSNELKKIGVMVDFEDACQEFARTFKQQASLSSITKEHVISFLQCYRNLKKLERLKFPNEFLNCIRQEKWIRTRLGDYRSPNDCILFSKDWEPIVSPTHLLPFIDDTTNFYGNEIHDYRVELKELGVVTNFKDGTKFIAAA